MGEGRTARRLDALLMSRFPGLRGKLPWLRLGDWPTPVEPMERLGARIGRSNLWVKREDLSSKVYGGNKVRKLELLFGRTLEGGQRPVVTVGAAGSNHVVATAVHAARVGIPCGAVLVPQPNQPNVRNNLRCVLAAGCRVVPVRSTFELPAKLAGLMAEMGARHLARPLLIWVGGSSVTGALGYVEFALELEQQVAAGVMPEPSLLVLPVGSGGTMAGIVAGLKLTRLETRVLGVGVYSRAVTNEGVVRMLANRVLHRLRKLDPSVPRLRVVERDVEITHEYYGRGYARPTRRAVKAAELLTDAEELHLDPTYTGKAAAAFLTEARRRRRVEGPLLFVATYNSRPLAPLLVGAPSPEELPRLLRRYFEEPPVSIDEL